MIPLFLPPALQDCIETSLGNIDIQKQLFILSEANVLYVQYVKSTHTILYEQSDLSSLLCIYAVLNQGSTLAFEGKVHSSD